MSFIRPEAAREVKRWRGALVSGAVLALGLWWGLTSLGLVKWTGWALAAGGGAMLWASVQRARFRASGGGLGVVELDERQIIYLAPVGGGMLSLDGLREVAILPDMSGLPVWRFTGAGERLSVPASAAGAEALFDALTALPGADIEAAIRASRARPASHRASHPGQTVVIWRR
ncbi:MAG: hypothetical protein CSA74_03100 [Rhodobacterales bacterium]|nr:MAG: hypothetical protein CSA74_03100 [Rhodobacterales bacterium]